MSSQMEYERFGSGPHGQRICANGAREDRWTRGGEFIQQFGPQNVAFADEDVLLTDQAYRSSAVAGRSKNPLLDND